MSKRYNQVTGPNRDEKSTYDKWPIEHPTRQRQNKMLWREALQTIISQQLVLEKRLGKWSKPPHYTQRWFYDAVNNTVYHERGDYMDEYVSVEHGRPDFYTCSNSRTVVAFIGVL